MKPYAKLTPYQQFQHRISACLAQAADDLDDDKKAWLAHYVHQRVLVELGPPIRDLKEKR